jgi:hypothetical protein
MYTCNDIGEQLLILPLKQQPLPHYIDMFTVWVPVRRNWRVYVKFVGTLPFPIIDCQKRKGSM